MIARILLAAVAISASGTAWAQAPCPLTYETFEAAVPHLDLETCPAALKREGAFCRASAASDAVHVFVFSETGDQCLLASKSFSAGQYAFDVK